jgi:predicted small metal-binding protein
MSVHGFRGRIAVWRETPTDARGDTVAKLVNCECGEIVRGETDDELVENVNGHVKRDHPELVGAMSREDILAMSEEA